MTAKAQMKPAAGAAVISNNGNEPTPTQADYKLIPWADLQTSPTNPRRRINDETIQSLSDSIRTKGILEPLIVRPIGKGYEIVCGERRYRAAEIAEMLGIPCLVRELSDEEVLDIQIHENLHREDVHPMDEAYGYQVLKEKLGCDTKELALRVGKPEGYVLNRLKLNLLIKEAQKDVDDQLLPLSYALEIAKYSPDIQKYIYAEVYRKEGKYRGDRYVQVAVKGETVSWKSFIDWINTNIHRLLSKAPFDPKATNLHPDGLACSNCPERTGALVNLFESNQVGKKDSCLNPSCFLQKVKTHVEVRRRELADLRQVEPSEVPLVRSWCYLDGEDYLGTESASIISGTKRDSKIKKCNKTISAIDIEPENYGQTVQVCLKTTGCKIHWREMKGTGTNTEGKSTEAESAERLEAHRARREEIWNAKVAEAVRVRVFKLAAEKFEKKFRITDVGIDLLPQMIARFWRMTSSGDTNNLNTVIKPIIPEWLSQESEDKGLHMSDMKTAIEQLKNLGRGLQFRILFLLIHSHKGTIGHNNYYSSQNEVKELAAEFEVDYRLIDAEVRLELCSKKYSEVHETYLGSVKANKKEVKIPNLFSEKWQPRD